MENFRQWLEGYIHKHALDRLRSRLAPWPDILKRVEKRTEVASDVYNDGGAWAVQIDELPNYAQTSPIDGSNGDMVVIVIRPDTQKEIPAVITGFLRRSAAMEGKAQPFTPESLRVDNVVTLPEFNRHALKFIQTKQTMRDVA